MQNPRSLTTALCLLSSGLLASSLFAQQVAQPTVSGTATAAADDVIHLSVFSVTGQRDEGYQAFDTTSGSRIKTALRDTAAAISPFTTEFLDDIAATTVEDIMAFAPNVEGEFEDSGSGFNDGGARFAGSSSASFRNRGMPLSKTIDYTPFAPPVDTYNTAHVELASGPNSILFGMGSQGGVLNFASKRADAQRNRLRVKGTLGTWTSPSVSGIPFQRAELDYNLVLKPRAMGLRLMGLYQDGGNTSWRYWSSYLQKRITPAVYIKPFKNTTINIRYETGTLRNPATYAWNTGDMSTAWTDSGRQLVPTYNAAGVAGPPGTVQTADNDNRTYVYVPGGANGGTLYYTRNAYETTNRSDYTANPQIRLPSYLSSYYYNSTGPGGYRDQKFDDLSIIIEQRLGNFNFELGYFHNKNDSTSHTPREKDATLMGDPNTYLGAFDKDDIGAASIVGNPNKQSFYLEDMWQQTIKNETNNVIRLIAEYSLNLKKFGRHRLIGLVEHSENEQFSNFLWEILADQNQRAITNAANPAAAANFLVRRNYVTEGDFRTYYIADWNDPIPAIAIRNQTYHNAYVSNGDINHVKTSINTAALTLQSFMFRDKLVTTLGLRFDDATAKRELNAPVTAPGDPRIRNRTKVLNEADLTGQWSKSHTYQPYTATIGGVYHPFRRLSLFANYSNNRGLPILDGRTVLPDGDLPPLTEGRTFDYGVMLDPLGNGKIVLRLTRFDTQMLHDATINPTGVLGDENSYALSSTNLQNIYNALYQVFGDRLATDYGITRPPSYTSGMVDMKARGYEAELTANLGKKKAFTLRAAFSYTDRNRANALGEVIDYFNANIPQWMHIADPALNGGNNYHVDTTGLTGAPAGGATLHDFIVNQIYAPGNGAWGAGSGGAKGTSVRQSLINQLNNQNGPMGARPWKLNITARYNFQEGFLKGIGIGGSMRYQTNNYMPNPDADKITNNEVYPPPPGTTDLAFDPGPYGKDGSNMLKGSSLLFYDAFISYRCKIFGGRTTMKLQLNIKNIFNNYLVTVGRITPASAGNQWTRVYVNDPRTFRLSATFDF